MEDNLQAGVLCSGSIVFDILTHPVEEPPWGATTYVESIEYHLGGNGANTARAAAASGVKARLLGSVGNDDQASYALETLERAGVDVEAITRVDAPTAATVVMVNRKGDRRFLHRLGASARALSQPIDFARHRADGFAHYHLATLFLMPLLRPRAPETLASARAAGFTTSIDTNWDPHGLWMRDLGPCLPHLDVLFVNEDEARMTAGTTDPRQAARLFLSHGAGAAVIKLGPRGCAIYNQEREIMCPGYVVEVKDTTGAGDCFVGAFLAARMRGAGLAECGEFANAAAALTVQHIGAAPGMRCKQQVIDWMRSAAKRE